MKDSWLPLLMTHRCARFSSSIRHVHFVEQWNVIHNDVRSVPLVCYRIFNKLFFVILNLFRFSFIQMKLTCVWCIFWFFKKFSLSSFLNCGYLFCLTRKTVKITMKEQREREERKKNKKYIFNSKKV